MAKNYTMTEVANIFATGTDSESMADIGKRYPLLAIKMTALVTKAPKETVDIFGYMPDYLSANKVNKAIKDGGEDVSEAEDDETEVPAEKPAKKPVAKEKAKAAPKAKAEGTDYDSMNNKQMYDLLGELGERKACKAEFGDLSKASMTAYLKKHHGDGATAEAEDEAEEETGKYDGKKAPELYALCKKRGIKAEPKKTAKYYIDLLEKADAAEAEAEAEDEADDDWGDEAEAEEPEAEEDDDEWKEPEEKPKKKAGRPKKAATKPVAKKAAKKAEAESEDDDDDWDN